jgi:hypothetical protein
MIRVLLTLVALLLGSAAQAGEVPAGWAGVWRGTIGDLPVSLCIGEDGVGRLRAAYYYHSQMTTIRLDKADDGSLIEHGAGGEAVTGTWRLDPGGAKRLTGTWSQGASSLPIRLAQIAVEAGEDVQPCGSRAFIAPRIRPVKLIAKPQRLGSFAYDALSWDVGPGFGDISLESFAFRPVRPGDAAINAALRIVPGKAEGPGDYIGCVLGAQEMGGDGDYHIAYTPNHASNAYLSALVSSDGYCGGAHPFHGYSYQTWDRATGREVRLHRWFGPAAVKVNRFQGETQDYYTLTPAFAKFLSRKLRFEESECRSAVEEAEFWEIGLTPTGMVFTPSLAYVLTPCVDDAKLSYAELARWLNAAGKAGAARLRGR